MKAILQDELNTLENIMYSIQQRNLVYNYNFLLFSNQENKTIIEYNHPDGWIYNDSGSQGEITFDTDLNCCKIVTGAENPEKETKMILKQCIHEFPRWRETLCNQRISAVAVISSPDPSCILTFCISDGVSENSKTITLNPANPKQDLEVNLEVSENATGLFVSIECEQSVSNINVYKVYANIGKMAFETLPCIVEGVIGERKQYMSIETPPATELSLCQKSIELPQSASESYTRLNSFLNGKFGIGPEDRSMLPDMRGYFSRAWNNGATIDTDAINRSALGTGEITGDHVGTVELDQYKQHDHELKFDTSGELAPGTVSPPLPVINNYKTSKTNPSGGSETRPKNIAELYTIKWA